MTRFLDGPAKGISLSLVRSPLYLRVVRDAGTGKWDALDALDDGPEPSEVVYVYAHAGRAGTVHIDYRDAHGRRRGRWESIEQYRHVETAAEQESLRDRDKWRAWCVAEQKRSKAEASGA